MVIKYLTELLYDNDCVIVPGFGAFITQRHPAVIDYTNNRFAPPYKEIVFNDKLNSDDGLLAGFISEKEHITGEESTKMIHDFVNQVMAILEVESNVGFEGFGVMTVDFKGDYVFTIADELNLLSDSYGLDTFNCNAIYRTETYHDIRERIIIEQKQRNTEYSVAVENIEDTKENAARRQPKLFKTLAYASLVFLFVFMINWTTDKSGSNLASWNPFLYSSPNEFLITVMNSKSMPSDATARTAVPEISSLSRIEAPLPIQTLSMEPALIAVSSHVPSFVQLPAPRASYFIVGGSFQTEDSAEKCLDKIRRQGFDDASLLGKNSKGYIRVCYESFADKQEALIRLETIRKDYDESAWLLFQK